MLRGIVKGKEKSQGIAENPSNKQESIQQKALERFQSALEKSEREKPKKPSNQALKARRRTVHNKDSIAMERIMGGNDLMPISYLDIGSRAAKSVCRIALRDRAGKFAGYGTGFLVAPGLIMTNNHVLEDRETAMYAMAEFNYQEDENFKLSPVYTFSLEPERFFLTNEELDYTIVAVKEEVSNDKKIEDFGFIRLIPEAGKVLPGEYVSIIQHPNGGPKAVTLRENEVKFLYDDFIHYLSDTEPGSSGSPVFNDQWTVVGLHHSGVPHPEDYNKWIANEGVRISSIAADVKKALPNMKKEEKEMVKRIFPKFVEEEEPSEEKKKKGYDEKFLGDDYAICLPQLSKVMKEDVSRKNNGNYVLDYVHFSIVMCRSRGLAYFTAVNIDAKQRVKIPRGRDNWRFDSRISEKDQYGNEVYRANDLDRGHLVRREDPNWGKDAQAANEDTFHFTNSSPQHKNLNQKIWLGLEDYILKNAETHGLKVSVFTGPVFREDDMVYRKKYRIPRDFWKVVVVVKKDGKLSATAYLQTQEDMIRGLEFAYGQYETYQVPVTKIEELTGLRFGDLPKYDPLAKIEATAFRVTGAKSIRL